MNTELEKLNLHTLQSMYDTAVNELNTQLLIGSDWTDLSDLRILVTELSGAVHRKLASINNNRTEQTSGEMGRKLLIKQ